MKLRKTFELGRIAFISPDRATCPVTVDVSLTRQKDEPVRWRISAEAAVWNHSRTSIYLSGDCFRAIQNMLTNNVRTSKGFELDTFNMLSRIHANSQLYGTSLQNLLIRSYKEYPGFDLVAQKEVLRQNNILFELCANNVLYEYASTKLYTPLPVHYLSQLASAVSGLPINGSEAFHGAEVARKRHNMFRCGTGQDGEVEVGLHEMLRENDEDFAAYYDTPKILYCTRDYYSNSPDYTRLKRAEEYDGISSISCRIDKDKVLRVVPDDCADIMFSYVHILSDFGVKRATKMQRAETEVAQNRVLAVSAPMPRIN